MWCVTDVIVSFHFGIFLFYPLIALKIKIFKKRKKHLEISFYICVPKILIRWCTVPEIWCATDGRTDRQTGGRMEKVKYRGGYPAQKFRHCFTDTSDRITWIRKAHRIDHIIRKTWSSQKIALQLSVSFLEIIYANQFT